MLLEQFAPHGEVTILDVGKAPEHVATLFGALYVGKHSVEEGGVALVLPMLAESGDVGRARLVRRCRGRTMPA